MAKKAPTRKTPTKRIPAAKLQHIAEDLRPLAVPLDSLTPDPRNANQHNERSLSEIARSLQEHGQQKPIVVRKRDLQILAGNGTFEVFKRLGWDHIAVTRMDAEDAAAAAFAIRDNRTAQFSQWDAGELSSLLEELDVAGMSAAELGFTTDELDALIADAAELADAAVAGSGDDGSGDDDAEVVQRHQATHTESEAADQTGQLTELWQVLVTCADEDDQRAFLAQMKEQQRGAKALNT